MSEVAPWFFLIYGFFVFSLFYLAKAAKNKFITVIINLFIVVLYSGFFINDIAARPVATNMGAGLAIFAMVCYLGVLVVVHSIINLITAFVLFSKNKKES